MSVKPMRRYTAVHFRIVERAILIAGLVLGALITATAQASSMYHWVAWIGLLPLFMAVRRLTGISAAVCGVLWGAAVYLFAIVIADSGAGISLRFVILHASIPALYLYGMSWFIRRFGYSALALALGWIVVEVVARATGAYSGLIGIEHSTSAIFKLIADFLGTGFIAFVIVYISAFVISFTWPIWYQGAPSYVRAYATPASCVLESQAGSVHLHYHHRTSRPRAPPAPA